MMIYAVIDTNVLLSALLTKNPLSATTKVLNALQKRKIKLLYNSEILNEYKEVFRRPKFKFDDGEITDVINFIESEGLSSQRIHSTECFPDPKDIVFYEVALSKEDAYLVTGNKKHFPQKPIVVTPSEMLEILEQ
ncbi:MAG: putative toxin-antitoxin system toxin component, PIN family [Bacteroidales bacterium]|nr:putative toxin-antitoxin system toxin component, PIN family [Bacteroidales bacterium]